MGKNVKLKFSKEISIDNKIIGDKYPTYFIADVAANHDGDLNRAKDLIYLAAEAGADAAKFQHFTAKTIVSDFGFKNLEGQLSHQSSWKKSVYEIYEDASINFAWTSSLQETCKKAGITFFTSPYSFELVDEVDPYVLAYKIGSGDITWHEIIRYMAKKGKPVLLATGAATADEIHQAVTVISEENDKIVLMQCNTNYTAQAENFNYINLNVLKTFKTMYPEIILGLSDHTSGHATVLGAITLGARVIEKHFTDNIHREGPDHGFSMDPTAWKEMVSRSRELELALGGGVKKIEENEKNTVVIQRRSIRARKNLAAGQTIEKEDLEVLRPCPENGLPPYKIGDILGKKIVRDVKMGDHIIWEMLT